MQETTCDRCGSKEKGKFGMSSIHFRNDLTGKNVADYDLCSKCINELAYIVKGWVEKYGKNVEWYQMMNEED